MALLNVKKVSEWLGLSENALQSRSFRNKLGLPGIKIGGSLRFDSHDIERLIESGRELVPVMPREGEDAAD